MRHPARVGRDLMKIRLNEKEITVGEGAAVEEVRRQVKPDADVVIQNGFPTPEGALLKEGDELVLIRRGEKPTRDELESLLTARHTPGVHAKVKQGRVAVAGLGGLGSAVAIALARTGVGGMILADFDVVEPSNLNRQQFFLEQAGMPKTEALAANLLRINPFVEVTTHSVEVTAGNAPVLFAGADVVVEAFDRAEAKAMLIDTVLRAMPGVPVVAASGLAGFGPADRITTHRRAKGLYVIGDEVSEAGPGEGLMAPRVGVAAHHQANAVLRLLLGEDPVE
jgi:sulfur carrier protein ThiS adenylyltransferase